MIKLSWAAQVREYSKAEEAEQAEGSAGAQGLREEANAKRRQLEQWSASAYGEVCVPARAPARHISAMLQRRDWRCLNFKSRRLTARHSHDAASIVYTRHMVGA